MPTKLVEATGFKPWPAAPAKADVRPGSRWYAVNRDRTIVAFVIGTEPLTTGARIVNTHNDSVRLELKPKPFRDSFDIALLDTIVHGGIKNYQWVNRPLAIIGRVTKTDGTVVTIDIGHAPGDPVLLIAGPRAARRPRLPGAAQPRRHPDRGARSDAGARRATAAMQGAARTSTA